MKCKLSEMANITMGQSPKGSSYNKNKTGKPFLQGRKTFGRIYPYIDTWTTEPNRIAKKGSILMSVRAPVGDVNIANSEICIGRGLCSINAKNSNNRYLYYLLINSKSNIVNKSSGTVFDSINRKQLEDLEINIHNEKDQRKISSILSRIDEKIELNTHTNNNLYKIFRNIYKNTFSNKNCNFIKFKDYKDIGTLIMGQSPKGSSYNEKGVGLPLINGAADYKDGMLNSNKYTSEPTRVCNPKDLVFCIRATIGQLTIADQKYCLGRGVACISNINEIYYEYVFNIIEDSIDKLKAVATGSVILGLSKDDINNLEVYQPMFEEIEKFHKLEQPILKKIIDIKEQNKVLEQIRDTLLPKLMNGEIDLDKVEI